VSSAKGSASIPSPLSGLRAVLFDAGNTLVFLDYDRMAQGVGSALGLALTGEALAARAPEAAAAMERSAGTDQERAAAYLEALFRFGGVPVDRMGEVRDCLGRMHAERHLWCSVQDRTRESLGRLRAAGLRLGIVSNSDGRVDQALEAAGLREYFNVVIDSSLVGVEKPDPAIFRAALDALGVAPHEALYVGDLYEVDIVGAQAAGMEAVLLTSSSTEPGRPCRTTSSIHALVNALLPQENRMVPTSNSQTPSAASRRGSVRPVRVLVAKPGLDGHDRGAKVVAAALRDAGMEVVYTGLHQTPEMIATAAVQEDVDVVGLSILSGAHMTLFPRVRSLLTEMGRPDTLVTGGGIIPPEDMAALQQQGIGKLFGPGTPTSDLIEYIEQWAASHLES
jgi:methylmalonyl-CoA mutase, C-terminal domain